MNEQQTPTQHVPDAVLKTLAEAARERHNAAAANAERQRVSARIAEISRTLSDYERTLVDLRNRDRALGVDETAAKENVANLIRMAELLCKEMGVPVPDVPDLPPPASPQQQYADDPLGQPYASTPWSEPPRTGQSPIGDALAASDAGAADQRPALPETDVTTTRADMEAPGQPGGDVPSTGGFHPGDPAGDRDA